MLKVKNISASYGDAQVLHDICMEVGNGESVALIGSNGAGKSTLLKAIAGLVHATSGSIEWNGVRIDDMEPYDIVKLGIALLPEGRELFTTMTVLENLEVGAYVGEAKKGRKESIENAFKLFPRLKERSKQRAGTLSGGEQQMLALCRALMSRPQLLMIDEPSLGLAPTLVQDTYREIERSHKQGIASLIVEQNVHQVLTMADKAYLLEEGRIVIQGKGEDLLKSDHIKRAYLHII